MLLEDPKTPLLVRVVSLLVALAVGAIIVHLVFTFGYYASGLAALDAEEKRRREAPIPMEFTDPNGPASRPGSPSL